MGTLERGAVLYVGIGALLVVQSLWRNRRFLPLRLDDVPLFVGVALLWPFVAVFEAWRRGRR